MLGLGLHDLERGLGAGGLARADGGGENGLFGVGAQVLDDLAGGGDKAAGAGERFRHAPADDVDLVVEGEVIDGAAALTTEYAETMGVVDDGEAIVFLGDFG